MRNTMPITCNDLLALKYFSSIKLLAGAKGLERAITWPHIGQTTEISPWVHGGELLFITGIVHSKETLPALLDECIRNKLSGLVILVGSKYIENVPPELVEQAEAAGFPLFSMPFQLKLIDVTKEIADLIVRDKLERKKEEDFLSKLLFSPEADLPELVKAAFPDGMQPEPPCFVCVFGLSPSKAEKPGAVERLQHHVLSLCSAKRLKVYTMTQNDSVICLVFAASGEKAGAAASYLEASREVISQLCGDEKLILSFGRVYDKCREARKSHNEASSALRLARKVGGFNVVHHQKLGIYYLLLQIGDLDKLREYYHDFLDPILEHDKENNADLLSTLKAYLLCNGNIAKTSQKVFIHRNTLLYRLNQMRDLTGWDLEDAHTRMNLFVGILVREYLQENG